MHMGEYMTEMRKEEDRIREKLLPTHPFRPLITEIDKLKQTLCKPHRDDSPFSMRIEEHAKKIQDTIPSNPQDISCFVASVLTPDFRSVDVYCPYPLCRLLNKDKCCPKEIPLAILELLVTAGFESMVQVPLINLKKRVSILQYVLVITMLLDG